MVNQLENYQFLKQDVIDHLLECRNQVTIINDIKSKYETQICSKRSFEKIDSPSALIRILEKRNCLSINAVNPLLDIINHLDNSVTLKKKLEEYKTKTYEKTNKENSCVSPPHKSNDIENKKKKILEMISEEIGKNWKNFGRSLHIKEADLDSIHERHPTDLKSKVLEILRVFEKNTNSSNWFIVLCDALKESRRNDLKLKIMKIYQSTS